MNPQPTLLDIPPAQRGPTTRQKRAAQVAAWKEAHDIYTHCAPPNIFPESRWLALSMLECREALGGYDLSAEEECDGAVLLAGYCRLLDDAGVIEYGPTSSARSFSIQWNWPTTSSFSASSTLGS